ncbi:MAG: LOG family protein [Syntrophales bacterium]
MPEFAFPHRKYKTRSEALDLLIHELIEKAGGSPNADLLEEIIVSTLRMREDNIDRGDIKILNTALKELRYALSVYTPYRQIRKVAIFGSARTPATSPEYKLAREFARYMVRSGWMVITGAASGIMHAGNEGAGRAASFGANIRLPFEQHANPHIDNDPKLVNFKYFFTRKLVFIKESDATVLFPGGFGTHDEGFESLTLVQTGKADPRPVVLMDSPRSKYWSSWLRFIRNHLEKGKMIDRADMGLIHHTHDPREAVRIIADFYRNYHSIRYIRDRLVLRIKNPLSPKKLVRLNKDFKDIISSGSIEQHLKPFEEEANEPLTANLIRLSFHFDRHGVARMHELIREINKGQ